jgi:hypothetical protein
MVDNPRIFDLWSNAMMISEELLLEKWRSLSSEQQQAVLQFIKLLDTVVD